MMGRGGEWIGWTFTYFSQDLRKKFAEIVFSALRSYIQKKKKKTSRPNIPNNSVRVPSEFLLNLAQSCLLVFMYFAVKAIQGRAAGDYGGAGKIADDRIFS